MGSETHLIHSLCGARCSSHLCLAVTPGTQTRQGKARWHGHRPPSPAGAPRAAASCPCPLSHCSQPPKPPRFNRARPARIRTMPVCSPLVSARTASSASPFGHSSGTRRDPRGKGAADPPPVTRTTRFVPLGRTALPMEEREPGMLQVGGGTRGPGSPDSRSPGEAGRGGGWGCRCPRPSGGRGGGKPSPGGTERAPALPPQRHRSANKLERERDGVGVPKTTRNFFPGRRRHRAQVPPEQPRPRRPFLTSAVCPSGSAASNFLRAPKKRRRAASQSTPSRDSASRRVGRLILGRREKSGGGAGRRWGRAAGGSGHSGSGAGGQEGFARPPRSRRCESRAVHALQGRGGEEEREEEAPGGGGLEPERLAGERCGAQAAGLVPREPLACSLRAGGEAAPGTGTPRGAGVSVCHRGRPSLCPAPVSESGPLAHEGMRGAGQRRCEFGPGRSRSRSPPDSGARGGHRSTTHRGGSDMMGRLI